MKKEAVPLALPPRSTELTSTMSAFGTKRTLVRRGFTSAFDPKLTSHLGAVALEWLFQAQRELALRRIRHEHGHTTQRALGAIHDERRRNAPLMVGPGKGGRCTKTAFATRHP